MGTRFSGPLQWLSGKEFTCSEGATGNVSLILGSGRSLEEGMGTHSLLGEYHGQEPGGLQGVGFARGGHNKSTLPWLTVFPRDIGASSLGNWVWVRVPSLKLGTTGELCTLMGSSLGFGLIGSHVAEIEWQTHVQVTEETNGQPRLPGLLQIKMPCIMPSA